MELVQNLQQDASCPSSDHRTFWPRKTAESELFIFYHKPFVNFWDISGLFPNVWISVFGWRSICERESLQRGASTERLTNVFKAVINRAVKQYPSGQESNLPVLPKTLSDSLHSQSHQRYSTYIFNSYSVLFPHWLHQSLSIHLTASVYDTHGFSRGIQGRFERNKDFTKCIFRDVKICINLKYHEIYLTHCPEMIFPTLPMFLFRLMHLKSAWNGNQLYLFVKCPFLQIRLHF